MPRAFSSFTQLAEFFAVVVAEEEAASLTGIRDAITIVHEEARHELGTYQAAAGPFAAWSPLAEATQVSRGKRGKTEDEPLLVDGTLRDNVEMYVEEGSGAIGVPSREVTGASGGKPVDIGMIALVQEEGNAHVPPRSFLGGAMARKEHEMLKALMKPLLKLLDE